MAASYGAAVAAAMRSGNYVAAGGDAPAAYADLNETARQDQARHAALLRRVDAEKRARRIVVPTGDDEVRALLRKLGHPVRLFGESAADVRERLRSALARVEIEGEDRELVAALLQCPALALTLLSRERFGRRTTLLALLTAVGLACCALA